METLTSVKNRGRSKIRCIVSMQMTFLSSVMIVKLGVVKNNRTGKNPTINVAVYIISTFVWNKFPQRQNPIYHKQRWGVGPLWYTTNNPNSPLLNFQKAIQMHIIRLSIIELAYSKLHGRRLKIPTIQLHFLTIAPIWVLKLRTESIYPKYLTRVDFVTAWPSKERSNVCIKPSRSKII
jgi:hypothetical protein